MLWGATPYAIVTVAITIVLTHVCTVTDFSYSYVLLLICNCIGSFILNCSHDEWSKSINFKIIIHHICLYLLFRVGLFPIIAYSKFIRPDLTILNLSLISITIKQLIEKRITVFLF